jgi:transketolase
MVDLTYVPLSELSRLRSLETTQERRVAAFAAACRINILYMITRAGSGHIGTSFSALDLLSWLFLEEMRLPAGPGAVGDLYFSSKGHDAPAD